MNGTIDYLLDTNYVLAVVKQNPVIEADKGKLSIPASRFAISAITWIELFSYPEITTIRTITVIVISSTRLKADLLDIGFNSPLGF